MNSAVKFVKNPKKSDVKITPRFGLKSVKLPGLRGARGPRGEIGPPGPRGPMGPRGNFKLTESFSSFFVGQQKVKSSCSSAIDFPSNFNTIPFVFATLYNDDDATPTSLFSLNITMVGDNAFSCVITSKDSGNMESYNSCDTNLTFLTINYLVIWT